MFPDSSQTERKHMPGLDPGHLNEHPDGGGTEHQCQRADPVAATADALFDQLTPGQQGRAQQPLFLFQLLPFHRRPP